MGRRLVIISLLVSRSLLVLFLFIFFFFSSRRRHTRFDCDWSSDVCSSDLTFSSVFLSLIPVLLSSITCTKFSYSPVSHDSVVQGVTPHSPENDVNFPQVEIGRASCRERV